jgi:hypothetical protein
MASSAVVSAVNYVTSGAPMSPTKIALLGAIAGFTIFLGLPVGRLRNPAPRLRALLNASAIGVLVFLLWDVLAHAWEPIDVALGEHHFGAAAGNGVILAAGLGAGLLGLVTSTGGWPVVAPPSARSRSPRPSPSRCLPAPSPTVPPRRSRRCPSRRAGAARQASWHS